MFSVKIYISRSHATYLHWRNIFHCCSRLRLDLYIILLYQELL